MHPTSIFPIEGFDSKRQIAKRQIVKDTMVLCAFKYTTETGSRCLAYPVLDFLKTLNEK